MTARFVRRRGAILLTVLVASMELPAALCQEAPGTDHDAVHGAAAAFEAAAAARVWIEAGSRLRREPDAASPPITLVDAGFEAAVLDRRGAWLQVRYGGFKGWIADPATEPAPAAERASPITDAQRLAAALDFMTLDGEPAALGSFRLYTDVVVDPVASGTGLLDLLGRVAGELPRTYRQRYGLETPGGGEAVILFADEASYRSYAAATAPAALGVEASGHAADGVAALFVGEQTPAEVAAILVHELTHLLNRRALSTSLPPWLEEGLANDLAYSHIGAGGRLDPGSLGGHSVVVDEPAYRPGGWLGSDRVVYLSGPAAIRRRLAAERRSGDHPPLALITDLLAAEFFHPRDRQQRYDLSAFFVRYLLDGELASKLRAYLGAFASPSPPQSLTRSLGRDWPQLEEGLSRWLEATGSS